MVCQGFSEVSLLRPVRAVRRTTRPWDRGRPTQRSNEGDLCGGQATPPTARALRGAAALSSSVGVAASSG